MDNLISHLEKSLNEDECIKEALLLLRGLEHSTSLEQYSQSTNATPSQNNLVLNKELFTPPVLQPLARLDGRMQNLVILFGVKTFLQSTAFQRRSELPLLLVSFQLEVSVALLSSMCASHREDSWPHNFLDCCVLVVNCFERTVGKPQWNKVVTVESRKKAVALKNKLTQLQGNTHRTTGRPQFGF